MFTINTQFGFAFIRTGTGGRHGTHSGRGVTHETAHARLFTDWTGRDSRFAIGHNRTTRTPIGRMMAVLMCQRQLHVAFRSRRRLLLHRQHVGQHNVFRKSACLQ